MSDDPANTSVGKNAKKKKKLTKTPQNKNQSFHHSFSKHSRRQKCLGFKRRGSSDGLIALLAAKNSRLRVNNNDLVKIVAQQKEEMKAQRENYLSLQQDLHQMQEGIDHAVSVRLDQLMDQLSAPIIEVLNDGVSQAKKQVEIMKKRARLLALSMEEDNIELHTPLTSSGSGRNAVNTSTTATVSSCATAANPQCRVLPMVMGHIMQNIRIPIPKMDIEAISAMHREHRRPIINENLSLVEESDDEHDNETESLNNTHDVSDDDEMPDITRPSSAEPDDSVITVVGIDISRHVATSDTGDATAEPSNSDTAVACSRTSYVAPDVEVGNGHTDPNTTSRPSINVGENNFQRPVKLRKSVTFREANTLQPYSQAAGDTSEAVNGGIVHSPSVAIDDDPLEGPSWLYDSTSNMSNKRKNNIKLKSMTVRQKPARSSIRKSSRISRQSDLPLFCSPLSNTGLCSPKSDSDTPSTSHSDFYLQLDDTSCSDNESPVSSTNHVIHNSEENDLVSSDEQSQSNICSISNNDDENRVAPSSIENLLELPSLLSSGEIDSPPNCNLTLLNPLNTTWSSPRVQLQRFEALEKRCSRIRVKSKSRGRRAVQQPVEEPSTFQIDSSHQEEPHSSSLDLPLQSGSVIVNETCLANVAMDITICDATPSQNQMSSDLLNKMISSQSQPVIELRKVDQEISSVKNTKRIFASKNEEAENCKIDIKKADKTSRAIVPKSVLNISQIDATVAISPYASTIIMKENLPPKHTHHPNQLSKLGSPKTLAVVLTDCLKEKELCSSLNGKDRIEAPSVKEGPNIQKVSTDTPNSIVSCVSQPRVDCFNDDDVILLEEISSPDTVNLSRQPSLSFDLTMDRAFIPQSLGDQSEMPENSPRLSDQDHNDTNAMQEQIEIIINNLDVDEVATTNSKSKRLHPYDRDEICLSDSDNDIYSNPTENKTNSTKPKRIRLDRTSFCDKEDVEIVNCKVQRKNKSKKCVDIVNLKEADADIIPETDRDVETISQDKTCVIASAVKVTIPDDLANVVHSTETTNNTKHRTTNTSSETNTNGVRVELENSQIATVIEDVTKETTVPTNVAEAPASSHPRRAASKCFSYAEPKLGRKLRQGDPHWCTIYPKGHEKAKSADAPPAAAKKKRQKKIKDKSV